MQKSQAALLDQRLRKPPAAPSPSAKIVIPKKLLQYQPRPQPAAAAPLIKRIRKPDPALQAQAMLAINRVRSSLLLDNFRATKKHKILSQSAVQLSLPPRKLLQKPGPKVNQKAEVRQLISQVKVID